MTPSSPCRLISLIALIAILLTSCDRRDLEVVLDEKVHVKLVIDWKVNFQEIYNEQPNGMTVMLWGKHAAAPIVESVNSNTLTLALAPDDYQLIIYNDREEEFLPYMQLYDRQSFSDIAMRTLSYTSRSDNTEYMHYPEPIGVSVDSFTISDDMVANDTTIFVPYQEYIDNGGEKYRTVEKVYEIDEVATPMTVTVFLKAKVKRYQSIKSIEASLSGLADGFYLSRINRTRESGTIMLKADTWKLYKYGDTADSLGIVTNETPSFGLPYGKELISERNPEDCVLHFRITLTDDNVQDISFNVGKELRYITPEGREAQIRYRQDLYNLKMELDLTDYIVLPPTPGAPEGAGFDARVDEWEDGGSIDVGM